MFDRQLHAIEAKLDRILAILEGENEIMADLTALTAQVSANTDVIQSALTLIQGLAAQLQAAGTDPQKLADLASQLKAQDDALAAAVAANTVAAPAPASPAPSSPPATPTT